MQKKKYQTKIMGMECLLIVPRLWALHVYGLMGFTGLIGYIKKSLYEIETFKTQSQKHT